MKHPGYAEFLVKLALESFNARLPFSLAIQNIWCFSFSFSLWGSPWVTATETLLLFIAQKGWLFYDLRLTVPFEGIMGWQLRRLSVPMQLEYSKLMPLASLFDLCSSAFEKTEKRQAGPIRPLKRDVWVFFFPSLIMPKRQHMQRINWTFSLLDSSGNYWQSEEMKHKQTPQLWFIFWNRLDKLYLSSVHAPSRAMQGMQAYSHIVSWLDGTRVSQTVEFCWRVSENQK